MDVQEVMIQKPSSIPRCKNSANYTHQRPVQGDSSLTCVLEDGSRVFLRRTKRSLPAHASDLSVSVSGGSHLLSKSMKELKQEAKDLQVANLAAKARKEDALIFSEGNFAVPEDEAESETSNILTNLPAASASNQMGLWVDKYSPKEFSQLLSPEKVS